MPSPETIGHLKMLFILQGLPEGLLGLTSRTLLRRLSVNTEELDRDFFGKFGPVPKSPSIKYVADRRRGWPVELPGPTAPTSKSAPSTESASIAESSTAESAIRGRDHRWRCPGVEITKVPVHLACHVNLGDDYVELFHRLGYLIPDPQGGAINEPFFPDLQILGGVLLDGSKVG